MLDLVRALPVPRSLLEQVQHRISDPDLHIHERRVFQTRNSLTTVPVDSSYIFIS